MEHWAKMSKDKVHTINNVGIFVASLTLPARSKMLQISSYTLQYSKTKQKKKTKKKKTNKKNKITSLNKSKIPFLKNQICRGGKVAIKYQVT